MSVAPANNPAVDGHGAADRATAPVRARRFRAVAGTAAVVIALSSCSTTIIDSLVTTTTSSVVTTTTIPSGDVKSLLQEMSVHVTGLGNLIAANKKTEARARLQNVESVWIALQPQLAAQPNDVDDDVERIVNLVRSAVAKKRPADADKAARFVSLVIDAQS